MEKFDLLTLGEVLLRLSPKENKRIVRRTEQTEIRIVHRKHRI